MGGGRRQVWWKWGRRLVSEEDAKLAECLVVGVPKESLVCSMKFHNWAFWEVWEQPRIEMLLSGFAKHDLVGKRR